MKATEIKVGKMYHNRGKGMTLRKVIAIGNEFRPKTFFSMNEPPDEPGVKFMQMNKRGNQIQTVTDSLYLSSFASWAGGEVE